MNRIVAILGIMVIAAIIIISGSAVATYWAASVAYAYTYDCTDEDEALGPYDYKCASVGITGPPPVLGRLTLDMGPEEHWIPPSTDFVAFGNSSSMPEQYYITIWDGGHHESYYLGYGLDTRNENFTTPPEETINIMWRYIQIDATSGSSDPIYGPEIDAVGW